MSNPRNEGGGVLFDWSQNVLADPARVRAYSRLLEDVFDFVPPRPAVADPSWDVIAFFTPDGTCAAGVEIGELGLMLDDTEGAAMAIRLAGVAPAFRSRGLFRKLMQHALHVCDRRVPGGLSLLYTEDAALYTRFDFVPLVQHAFVGAPPGPDGTSVARPLDRAAAEVMIDRVAPIRAPVSRQCAVRRACDLLRANLCDDDLQVALLETWDALLIYERDAGELVIVDIVAERIPPMAAIVAALDPDARRVRTMFPPDRVDWDGEPVADETGLMVRGALPPAMRRPFMLPPTTSF